MEAMTHRTHMTRDETDVLAANHAFYCALRAGDFQAMDGIWAEDRTVTCTHPASHVLTGREMVMESWRLIMLDGEPPEIDYTEPAVVVTENAALVLCEEVIGEFRLMASNSFVRERGLWRMLNHQATHIPANES